MSFSFIWRSLLLGLMLTACTTYTIWDSYIYPSQYYEITGIESEQSDVICRMMEDMGYVFDEFSVSEYGVEVTYPDGEQRNYTESISLHPHVVVDMARDYNNPNTFSDEEWARLDGLAVTFCEDYQRIAAELHIDLRLSGVTFWDYVNGVRGGYYFSETCEITGGYGWGTGSYANRYTENSTDTCPSGQVEF
jgi:hypothetical protein